MAELEAQLKASQGAILCVTPENVSSPWLNFEAGAVFGRLGRPFVCPYLFGMSEDSLEGPVSELQSARADEPGTFKMLRSINRALEQPLENSRLTRAFEKWWPELRAGLDGIPGTQTEVEAPRSKDLAQRQAKAVDEILHRVRNLERREADQMRGNPQGFKLVGLADPPTTSPGRVFERAFSQILARPAPAGDPQSLGLAIGDLDSVGGWTPRVATLLIDGLRERPESLIDSLRGLAGVLLRRGPDGQRMLVTLMRGCAEDREFDPAIGLMLLDRMVEANVLDGGIFEDAVGALLSSGRYLRDSNARLGIRANDASSEN